jgi:beta-xylosidase
MKTRHLITLAALLCAVGLQAKQDKVARTSGNPILPEFHADPEVLYSEQTGKFYIYSTTDGAPGWGGYYFTVFSSKDLTDWRHEGIMLDLGTNQVPWATGNAWAPCIIERKTSAGWKYYFYYSGHDKKRDRKSIGVAVADYPTGPFVDQGEPIVTDEDRPREAHGGQAIDVDVFQDPVSGKFYLYWGNGFMAGAELNDDMLSIKKETVTHLTPKGGSLKDYAFREGAYVFYRQGKYYFLWSVDDTGSPNYHVAYGTSDSPLGPIEVAKEPVILIQDPAKDIYGPAHNSELQIPGRDEWYIVYHRINKNYLLPQPNGPGFHRQVCIDRMEFNPDGTIRPVRPTLEGVAPVKVKKSKK